MDKIRTKFFIFIIFKNQDYITDMTTKIAIENLTFTSLRIIRLYE